MASSKLVRDLSLAGRLLHPIEAGWNSVTLEKDSDGVIDGTLLGRLDFFIWNGLVSCTCSSVDPPEILDSGDTEGGALRTSGFLGGLGLFAALLLGFHGAAGPGDLISTAPPLLQGCLEAGRGCACSLPSRETQR